MADKSDYEWYKEHRICPRCGCNDAKAGRVFCESCLEKDRIRKAKHRQTHGQLTEREKTIKKNAYTRLVERRKANNLCVRCGEPKEDNGRQYCEKCIVKFKEYNRASYLRRVGGKLKYTKVEG